MAYAEDISGRERTVFLGRAHRDGRSTPASLPNLHLHISRMVARQRSAFPELDCIRNRLPLATLAAVERRAIETGVGADRVLIAAGICDQDSYMMALAAWLGLEFETFDGVNRASCRLDTRQLMDAAKAGLIPLVTERGLAVVVAPRSVRHFLDYASKNPRLTFRLTSTERLNRFIFNDNANALGYHAAHTLHAASPHMSAAVRALAPGMFVAAAVIAIAAALILHPKPTIEIVGAILTFGFVSWLLMRTVL